MPLPSTPKEVLELVAVLLVSALVLRQFDVSTPTLVTILAAGLAFLLAAAWPTS